MRQNSLGFVLSAAAGLSLCASAGCRDFDQAPPEPVPRFAQGGTLDPDGRGAKAVNGRKFLILIRFQLILMELPVGSTSDSAELWSCLSEEPLGARISAALGINGFRVGLGRQADRRDVRKILTRMTARSPYEWNFNTRPSGAVAIPLKRRQPTQTIFTFRPDRTLVGYDYEPGDNILSIIPTIDYDAPSAVHVSGAFGIRSTQTRPQYVETPGGYFLENKPVHYPLPGLDFKLVVPPGGFLLIGPSKDARGEMSSGAAFLLTKKDGVKFEKVLLIAPKVFYEPIPEPD